MRPLLLPDAQCVHFTPPQLFERRNAQGQGLQADIVTALERSPFKLNGETLKNAAPLAQYGEALVMLLAHELMRLNGGPAPAVARGGLSGWRRKRVADFIEEHLAENVRLTTLAALVDLSPYHFLRAFRQSFGVPPHRYHIGRRIERAKAQLAEPVRSVTAIALSLGFAETSSFSAAFRRITGCSPSQYRRGLD